MQAAKPVEDVAADAVGLEDEVARDVPIPERRRNHRAARATEANLPRAEQHHRLATVVHLPRTRMSLRATVDRLHPRDVPATQPAIIVPGGVAVIHDRVGVPWADHL